MGIDERIARYRQAVADLRNGRFRLDLPPRGDDELGRLGDDLRGLAATLGRKREEAARLAAITEKVNAGLVLDDVLDFVFQSFRPLIPYHRIGLALLEDDARTLRARWARSEVSPLHLRGGYAARMEGSSLEPLLRTGKPRILNDLPHYLAEHPGSDSTRRVVAEGMKSSLTCPLVALGTPIGFLFFSSLEAGAYQDLHQELFLQIAGQLSVIVDKSRVYQELMQVNKQLHSAREELEIRATHDPLTGIWNRGAILAMLEKEVARARRYEQPLAVVMADIDRFKRINDGAGHQAGDRILREVAQALSGCLRASESVGRYGGEEFLIVLHPADELDARAVLERIQSAVRTLEVEGPDGPIPITISQGAAVGRCAAEPAGEALVRVADAALYEAKAAGRDGYRIECLPAVGV